MVAQTSATQLWTTWDPDTSPAPDGFFSMRSLSVDLVASGLLDLADTDRFISTIHYAARQRQILRVPHDVRSSGGLPKHRPGDGQAKGLV